MARDSLISITETNIGPDSFKKSLLVLLVGLGTLGYGAYDYVQQGDAVQDAVEVDATVVETGVDSVSTRRGGPDYQPTATYEYSYQGESYTSSNVLPGQISKNYDTRSAAESVLEGYESGETATAYVDPDAPGESFLVNERSNSPLFVAALGGVMVLVGGRSALKSMVGA